MTRANFCSGFVGILSKLADNKFTQGHPSLTPEGAYLYNSREVNHKNEVCAGCVNTAGQEGIQKGTTVPRKQIPVDQ